MKLPLDAFSKSPETGKLFGNTSIPTLVDRLTLKPTRSSGRFVTAQRKLPVQKPRRELEYLLEPQSRAGCFPALTAGWVTMTKPHPNPRRGDLPAVRRTGGEALG